MPQDLFQSESITLAELNGRIANCILSSPDTQQVWVTAELSDVSVRNHCYMELVEKDNRGGQIAKARAVIWANNFRILNAKLLSATGQSITSGIKLMLKASATMHPVYGLSLVIYDLDPNYTMGDLIRRRNESIRRLQQEGILDNNKELAWPDIVQRIAIISGAGAAGYGDFMNQLRHNRSSLRFIPRLFPAVVQGESAPKSIINAIQQIHNDSTDWDCIVLIRGGGATTDLLCFEDYDLAANIAQSEIPVIIGIGHERDITLLDYVANKRVKTPTAAAEFLIDIGERALDNLDQKARAIDMRVKDIVATANEQLTYYGSLLPATSKAIITNSYLRLNKAAMMLGEIRNRLIAPQRANIDVLESRLTTFSLNAIQSAAQRLDNAASLLNALSPQAVLSRGYSITRVDGKILTNTSSVKLGDTVTTQLARGTITSTVSN